MTADPNEVARLLGLAAELDLAEDALDEAVHESFASQAADLNNAGMEAQIAHLLQGNSPGAVERLLRDSAGGGA